MEQYVLEGPLTALDRPLRAEEPALLLLTPEELAHPPALDPEWSALLPHTPTARQARRCKLESRRDVLCGTVLTPRLTRSGARISFGYLLTRSRMVLCDDSGAVRPLIRQLARSGQWQGGGVGRFFYLLLDHLLAKDLRDLEGLEDRLIQLEDQVLTGDLADFNSKITALRKETLGWFRYYDQLGELAGELEEDGEDFFSQEEQRLFHGLGRRLSRLQSEAQLLREYCLQVRELFQAELDLRQNRIMKILTVVTTLCLPLSLVAGWYGMNFVGMPELTWEYGYPAVIVVSVLIVALCLWIMKKKKFW